MKILYDHQAFTIQRMGGVSKCFCELIKRLPADIQPKIAISQTKNIHLLNADLVNNLQESLLDWEIFRGRFPFRGSGRIYTMLTKLPFVPTVERLNSCYATDTLKLGNYDVFHPTFFHPYFLKYIGNKPFVLTVHDMMPELFPQYFRLDDSQIVNKRKLVNKAAAIIAVSKQTKHDLIDILHIPEDKVHVIYHGGPQIEKSTELPLIDRRYILYVGTRGVYKNFSRLIKDLAKSVKCFPDMLLVCTYSDFTKTERSLIKEYGLTDNIIYCPATDSELKNLYAHAQAFVYPSEYEGFGMPILEAYAYGCPVLLNHRSCFPEIAGDAALYFNSDSISSNIDVALNTAWLWTREERLQMQNLGYERLQHFSWQKSASMLAEIYRNIVFK